jgi:hypothetical protein
MPLFCDFYFFWIKGKTRPTYDRARNRKYLQAKIVHLSQTPIRRFYLTFLFGQLFEVPSSFEKIFYLLIINVIYQ